MEVVNYAVYLLNQYPTKSLEDITPHEAWSGRWFSVSHLKIFESIIYTHILDQRRMKLEDKSEKFIFVSCDAWSKAYKLFDPKTKRIHVSRDMEFYEDGMWSWQLNKELFHEEKEEREGIKGEFYIFFTIFIFIFKSITSFGW